MISRMQGATPHFQARYQIKEPRNFAAGAADSSAGAGVSALGAINMSVAEANLPGNYIWGPASMALGAATALRGASILTQGIARVDGDKGKKVAEPEQASSVEKAESEPAKAESK